LCGAIPEALLPAHAAQTIPLACQAGQRVIEEGAQADSFFIVTDGITKSLKMLADGRLQIIGFLRPGALAGLEIAGHYEHSVEAIVTARLCRIPRAYLSQLLGALPALWQRLLAMQSMQLAHAHDHIVLLGRRSTTERLAGFLLWLADMARRATPGGMDDARGLVLPRSISRFDIADHLGMRFETVSRILGQMKEAGVIGPAPSRGIVIRDPACMHAIAQRDEALTIRLAALQRQATAKSPAPAPAKSQHESAMEKSSAPPHSRAAAPLRTA
jgi:CRP/FNR family transcriptional regulator